MEGIENGCTLQQSSGRAGDPLFSLPLGAPRARGWGPWPAPVQDILGASRGRRRPLVLLAALWPRGLVHVLRRPWCCLGARVSRKNVQGNQSSCVCVKRRPSETARLPLAGWTATAPPRSHAACQPPHSHPALPCCGDHEAPALKGGRYGSLIDRCLDSPWKR